MGWYIDIEFIPMSVIFNAKEINGHTTTITIENHLVHRKNIIKLFLSDLSLTEIDLEAILDCLNIAKRLSNVIVFNRRSLRIHYYQSKTRLDH